MRKMLVFLAVAAGLLFAAVPAQAVNIHYIGTPSDSLDGQVLGSSFKIAGLGDNVSIDVTLSATATAQFACFNKGGNHPQAQNKETFTGDVSSTGTFTSGKNGNVIGSLSVTAPGPNRPDGSEFTCPNGQRRELTFVSFTNVTLSSDAGTVNLPDRTFGALV